MLTQLYSSSEKVVMKTEVLNYAVILFLEWWYLEDKKIMGVCA